MSSQSNQPKRCASPTCLNDAAPGRRICYKCKQRKFRERDEERAAYHNNKANSKRRGIHNDLTLEQFRTFVGANGYMQTKGIDADSMTIDRKIPELGYTDGNLQLLTLADNARKGVLERARAFLKRPVIGKTPDCPF